MNKNVIRIVLTGGPAAGKTSLLARILEEYRGKENWRVITIPETVTELISGFGLGPFEGCMSMEQFQYFVVPDQLHKEQLALRAAEIVPQENVLIVYDRAVFDDLAYIDGEKFAKVVAACGKTECEILTGYDAVVHLTTCAKGAEFAFDHGNTARYEDAETARALDDRTLAAWSLHPKRYIIENTLDFEAKIDRALEAVRTIVEENRK